MLRPADSSLSTRSSHFHTGSVQPGSLQVSKAHSSVSAFEDSNRGPWWGGGFKVLELCTQRPVASGEPRSGCVRRGLGGKAGARVLGTPRQGSATRSCVRESASTGPQQLSHLPRLAAPCRSLQKPPMDELRRINGLSRSAWDRQHML